MQLVMQPKEKIPTEGVLTVGSGSDPLVGRAGRGCFTRSGLILFLVSPSAFNRLPPEPRFTPDCALALVRALVVSDLDSGTASQMVFRPPASNSAVLALLGHRVPLLECQSALQRSCCEPSPRLAPNSLPFPANGLPLPILPGLLMSLCLPNASPSVWNSSSLSLLQSSCPSFEPHSEGETFLDTRAHLPREKRPLPPCVDCFRCTDSASGACVCLQVCLLPFSL